MGVNKETEGDREKRKRDLTPTVSRALRDGTLVELVYDSTRQTTALVVWRDGQSTVEAEVILEGGECLVPFSPQNNIIKNDVVLLPSEPSEYGDKQELLDEIRQFLHRYLDVSPSFEALAVNYVLFTWLFDAFNEVPYLRLQGDYGCGKTRGLLVIGSLCYKPFFASGASTVSPIFHIIDAFRGTLVLDEADFRFSDEKAELVKVLNNGTVKGMPVLRTLMNRQREFNPQAFQVYGPKLVAMRRSYEDRALESRFLTEVMGGTALRTDIPINLPPSIKDEALALRNKLLLFRFRNRHAVAIDPTAMIAAATPRMNQILIPLMSIVDDKVARDAIVSFALATQEVISADRGLSTEAQLLEIIRELAGEAHQEVVPLLDLTDRFRARFQADYQRPITPRWIGTLLRQRLHMAPFKRHGRYVLSVVNRPRLETLYDRYGLAAETDTQPPLWHTGDGRGDMGTSEA
jgi:hypothetical protein